MRLELSPIKTAEGVWIDRGYPLEAGTESVIDFYYFLLSGRNPVAEDCVRIILDTNRFHGVITAFDLQKAAGSNPTYIDRLSEMPVWLCHQIRSHFESVPTIYVRPELALNG